MIIPDLVGSSALRIGVSKHGVKQGKFSKTSYNVHTEVESKLLMTLPMIPKREQSRSKLASQVTQANNKGKFFTKQ